MDYGNAHGNNNEHIHRLYQHHLEKEEQLKQQLRFEYDQKLKNDNWYILIGIALVAIFGAIFLIKFLFFQPVQAQTTPLVIYSVAGPPMHHVQTPVVMQQIPQFSSQPQTLYTINPHQFC